jgi:hypothetical protein
MVDGTQFIFCLSNTGELKKVTLKGAMHELIPKLTKPFPLEKSISEGGQKVTFRRRH